MSYELWASSHERVAGDQGHHRHESGAPKNVRRCVASSRTQGYLSPDTKLLAPSS